VLTFQYSLDCSDKHHLLISIHAVSLVQKARIAQERHQKFEIGKMHFKRHCLRSSLSVWRKYKAMRKKDIFNNSKSNSISPIPSHLAGNSEYHSPSPPLVQNRLHEYDTASSIWRAKMSLRALIALKNFTEKRKYFSVQGPCSRLREERELGDSTAVACRYRRSVPDQEKAVLVITAMKIVMRKWTSSIVKRCEPYPLTYLHRLLCFYYSTPQVKGIYSNSSVHNKSQVSHGAYPRSGGLSLVLLRTLSADHQSHHCNTDETEKVICRVTLSYPFLNVLSIHHSFSCDQFYFQEIMIFICLNFS
jgi:hypothetical protein